ncbi:cyanidin 3-O-rutinoside 5-O-glucosyltransferase-like [Iris pallida]|uniref:Glycosyltransferase n=1 Tax=Iris pallida TaxID=29817 RepID=A0AAX6FT64_IRIPA|nr:cyanidin 3-O-rutinoside 5-O-glucosyltransferase-like [Iris pallida]
MEPKKQHFLLVTYPAQGHINPVLHLARRLAAANGAAVTFSTAVSAHRRMFPSLAAPDVEVQDGPVAHIPFSDGFDEEGFVWGTHDVHHYLSQLRTLGSSSVSSILQRLHGRGSPVDCVVYTFFLPWAADVARANGVPSAQYWIQPATVFAIYYHYFHGYSSLITTACNSEDPMSTIDLPCLPSLRARDLPSFLTIQPDNPYAVVLSMFKDTLDTLDRKCALSSSKPIVLMNTFAELEEDALSAVEGLTLIPIGPILSSDAGRDLFKLDEKGYMVWLDSKPRGSVVYVSFGSMAAVRKEQTEEILNGMKDSGRPYLWVLRRECRWEGLELQDDDENGMVVEWCSQVEVLSHPSVGCFVTHCGWNSTFESLVCGVPTVGVPQWTDQATNAVLAEKSWGTGVRGEVNGEGVLGREELKRCLDLVMGEGESSVRIKRNVELWKDKATEAMSAGGSSYQNLRKFVEGITKSGQTIF